MLKNKWWIEENILGSGFDPAPTLGRVADVLGDEFTPMIFMTGDGHRNPPFQWTTRGVWPDFFKEVVQINAVCCHVEKYSDAVTKADVPPILVPVFNNNKVFGWEPNFYKKLQGIMELCLKAQFNEEMSNMDLGIITNGLNQLATMENILKPEANTATQLYLLAIGLHKDIFSLKEVTGLENFIKNIAGRRTIALRVEIHSIVGANIQKNIDKYSDHFHLIACGDAHIKCKDPLYDHIKPPLGTFGVADEMNH